MSFLYPRLIAISRPAVADEPSLTPAYSGLDPVAETPVAKDIRASIQLDRQGQNNATGLPSDGKATLWRVLFRRENGLLQARDVITDDLGVRYQVLAPYWNSLGYNALVERLET
jgi:hypothetical protein